MKKVFFLFVAIICQIPCVSQITFERNGLRAGDKLVRSLLSGKPSELSGTDMTWDLRGLDMMANSNLKYIGINDDSLSNVVALENGERLSFLLSEGELLFESRENYTSRTDYHLKEKRLTFPMSYGDSISGLFSGYGNYCDKLFIREFGSYKTKIDGHGTIILPNGDSLRNVLRITSEHLFTTKSYSLDSIRNVYGDSIPVYTNDSISFYMSDENGLLRSKSQYWYALGYRYPILETYSLSRGEDIPESSATWYVSPENQELLENDEENMSLREEDANFPRQGFEEAKGQNGLTGNGNLPFSYVLQNNKSSQTVVISFYLSCPAEVKVSLADIMGVVYKAYAHTYDTPGDYEIALDYRELRRGKYIVYINSNGSYAIEKFSKK